MNAACSMQRTKAVPASSPSHQIRSDLCCSSNTTTPPQHIRATRSHSALPTSSSSQLLWPASSHTSHHHSVSPLLDRVQSSTLPSSLCAVTFSLSLSACARLLVCLFLSPCLLVPCPDDVCEQLSLVGAVRSAGRTETARGSKARTYGIEHPPATRAASHTPTAHPRLSPLSCMRLSHPLLSVLAMLSPSDRPEVDRPRVLREAKSALRRSSSHLHSQRLR